MRLTNLARGRGPIVWGDEWPAVIRAGGYVRWAGITVLLFVVTTPGQTALGSVYPFADPRSDLIEGLGLLLRGAAAAAAAYFLTRAASPSQRWELDPRRAVVRADFHGAWGRQWAEVWRAADVAHVLLLEKVRGRPYQTAVLLRPDGRGREVDEGDDLQKIGTLGRDLGRALGRPVRELPPPAGWLGGPRLLRLPEGEGRVRYAAPEAGDQWNQALAALGLATAVALGSGVGWMKLGWWAATAGVSWQAGPAAWLLALLAVTLLAAGLAVLAARRLAEMRLLGWIVDPAAGEVRLFHQPWRGAPRTEALPVAQGPTVVAVSNGHGSPRQVRLRHGGREIVLIRAGRETAPRQLLEDLAALGLPTERRTSRWWWWW
jgi:hypothetical protein